MRVRRARLTRTFVCVLLGLVTVTAQAQNRIDTVRADAPALAAYGPHAIGVRTLRLVNPAQLDLLQIDPRAPLPAPLPRSDRALTVEVWYPAQAGAVGDTNLRALVRDGKTEVALRGRAVRDAAPAAGAPSPLVIVSHGFPGNRFLLSPLAENLASKGYVVAAIDHTDSTYDALGPRSFASTLVNRPLDQMFVLNAMARLSRDAGSFLQGRVDADRAAIVGYSMGGYGALISAGSGVSRKAVEANEPPFAVPHGLLGIHLAGSTTHQQLPDPRVKTIIAFAPWGTVRGVFDAQTLQGMRTPTLFIAGSVDDVSDYEKGVRATWQLATRADRGLLTFEHANHNAGAPMPPPLEAQTVDPKTGATMANHYIDAVWDNVRMNNVSQHFMTAWLGKYLRADATMDAYLDLVPVSEQGVWSMDAQGQPKPDHTVWKGFPNRTAKGLRFERLPAGR
jgi:predicted dienelactone hydrolase